MAGVMNRTARQFNLKGVATNGNRVTVRVAPGFNSINDDHWKTFVDGKKVDPYVKTLADSGQLEYGVKMDDKELDSDPDTKSKSKSVPVAQLKADLVAAEKQADIDSKNAEKAMAETETAKANEREATARAEKAELELAEMKKAPADKVTPKK